MSDPDARGDAGATRDSGTRSHADPVAATQLFERGYAVFERAYSPDEVQLLRGLMVDTYERLGRPPLRANPPVRPAEDVEIGPAGVVFHKLTRHHPEVAGRLFKRTIVDTIRCLLGDDMYLELPAGALSDSDRPFFDWHTHIDGVDDAYYKNKRAFPTFARSKRVTHLLYLDDLSVENGQLLVMPRKLTDPTPPPFDTKLERWEGQVAIDCPAGSVVVLEQCTWHAALRKTTPGIRAFVGSYFASGDTAPTPICDPTLREWTGEDELFRSVLPRKTSA